MSEQPNKYKEKSAAKEQPVVRRRMSQPESAEETFLRATEEYLARFPSLEEALKTFNFNR